MFRGLFYFMNFMYLVIRGCTNAKYLIFSSFHFFLKCTGLSWCHSVFIKEAVRSCRVYSNSQYIVTIELQETVKFNP